MLAVELIRRGARQFAGRRAVLFADQSLTFAEADELANRFAHVFARHGIRRGTPLALLCNNSLYSIPLDFACVKANAARTPLNSRLSLDEHERMLRETEAQLLVYGPDLIERAAALTRRIPGLPTLGLGAALAAGGDLLAEAASAPAADPRTPAEPDDVVVTVYTSGTTGRLKAAQHTQASWAAMCLNILLNYPDIGPGDVMLHAASLIHASGTFVLPYWVRGAASAVLARFDPAEYLAAISRWRVTAINLVPTMLAMLFEHPGLERADVSSLRTVFYGASPMPLPVIKKGLELWGPRFVQYYGQTEAPLFITRLSPEDHLGPEGRLLSCGRPALDAEVRLIDEAGEEVAAGEPGEIAVRAPFTMAGYFNAPDLNAATFLPGGWVRTRDVGRCDEEGYLYLVDRTSDMIITGGYNVYPREVEDALMAHPAVSECAVVGAPDEKWVEAVTAFVVLRPGAQVGEDELIKFVRARLASYKVPKAVCFTDQIPKSPVGKLLRRALRDPLWEGRERRI
jgi:acyl-CoA synthetase (AMP-forming)/AMP-acid ligase II